MWTWNLGRQNGSYLLFTLINLNLIKIKIDSHLIKFPMNSFIPEHIDTVDNYNHYRLNIILKKPTIGGHFKIDENIFSIFNRIFLFRPDLYKHSVSKIISGERFVWSLGIAFKKT